MNFLASHMLPLPEMRDAARKKSQRKVLGMKKGEVIKQKVLEFKAAAKRTLL